MKQATKTTSIKISHKNITGEGGPTQKSAGPPFVSLPLHTIFYTLLTVLPKSNQDKVICSTTIVPSWQ